MIAKSAIIDPAIADAAFSLPSGEVSQPVQGRFGVALVKIGKIEPGVTPTFESVAAQVKKEIATERARAKVTELHNKMEDERGGGASVVEAAQKLGLTAVTIDAVDRSGRLPNGQPVANIPRGLDVVSQAFNSDVGVDNDPIQFAGGYVWYDVLGITPSRERTLDEVRDQVEAKWRDDQISSKLRAKATEMVQKLEQGGTLAEEAAAVGSKVETATGFRRDASPPGVPSGVDHRGVPHRQGWRRTNRRRRRQRMDRVPRHRCQRAAGRDRLRRDEEAEGHAAARADRRTGRAIRHQDRIRDRHHHQSGRLRTGDGREQLSMIGGQTSVGPPMMLKKTPNPESTRWTTSNLSSEKSPPARRCRVTRRPPPSTA